MIVPMKSLLPLSVALAVVSWIAGFLDATPIDDSYIQPWLGIPVRYIAGWSSLACIALAVYGLIAHRLRGLWLALPLAVTLMWWAYNFWLWSAIMDACSKTGRCL